MNWLASGVCLALLAGVALTPSAAAGISCIESAGASQARRYVEQCRLVSPAAHGLCRPTYSCPLIQDEIRRGCALAGKDGPTFCLLYRHPG